jgi:hypothetical protein
MRSISFLMLDVRDRGRRVRRAIAVDDEARIILLDQRRAERVRQKPTEIGNVDVPGDVPFAFRLGNTQTAERAA